MTLDIARSNQLPREDKTMPVLGSWHLFSSAATTAILRRLHAAMACKATQWGTQISPADHLLLHAVRRGNVGNNLCRLLPGSSLVQPPSPTLAAVVLSPLPPAAVVHSPLPPLAWFQPGTTSFSYFGRSRPSSSAAGRSRALSSAASCIWWFQPGSR